MFPFLGLVSNLADSKEDSLEEALKTAVSIANLSPTAVEGTKKVLNYAKEHTVRDSLDYVAMLNMSQIMSKEFEAKFRMDKKKKSKI